MEQNTIPRILHSGNSGTMGNIPGIPRGAGDDRGGISRTRRYLKVFWAAVRYPRRGIGFNFSPPRSRDRANGVIGRKAPDGQVLAAHGIPDGKGREDVKIAW